MRFAALDIGTNSVLLAVAEREPGGALRLVQDRCTITRLGQEVGQTGRLAPDAIDRTLAALKTYADEMTTLGVTRRAAVGTAALREASNSDLFTHRAEALLGCPLEIISGEREAQLVLGGVREAFPELPPAALVFDVGGGSTEVISNHHPPVSLPLGAVRLTERHISHDPPTAAEVQRVEQTVRDVLANVPPSGAPLIAVGGTATTLASVQLELEDYDTARVNGLWLTVQQIRAQIQRFSATSLTSRREISGLEAARADVILAGALIIEGFLRHYSASCARICDRGVRWGLLGQLARR